MDFLEKDLEEIVFNADRELLSDKGLEISGKLLRQFKIGNYGIADLISIERSYHDSLLCIRNKISPILIITVYELKKGNISISAFLQAIRYVKGIKRFLDKRKFSFDIIYRIVLIGKNLDLNSAYSYVSDLIPENIDNSMFLRNFTYSYNINGILFSEESGYKLTNEGFGYDL